MKKVLLAILITLITSLPIFAIDSKELANSDNDKSKITLNQAMNMALEGNIELQEQRKNLGISQNDIKKANALKNPQLQSNLLVGGISRGNSSQVGISFPIEVAKRGIRKQAAQAGLLYTENKIKDYEFKLKLRIRTSYFNLLVAKSNLKIMQDRKELLEDLYQIAKNKPQSENYEIELLQADMKLKKQLIQINRAKANVRSAQYNFNRVLNLENNLTLYDTQEDSLFEQSFFIAQIDIPDYDILENAAFRNRYDIKMTEAKILKARKTILNEERKRVPDLYVGGGYAFTHDGQKGAYIGAGLDVPALYQYTPEIKNAKLEYEKAQLEYNSIINITKNIIHTNHDKFIIAQENVEHYKDILEESKRILQLAKQRYQKGKTPLTNLIVVEHSHQELLNEYLSAIGVYYNAYISLLQEIGVDNFSAVTDL